MMQLQENEIRVDLRQRGLEASEVIVDRCGDLVIEAGKDRGIEINPTGVGVDPDTDIDHGAAVIGLRAAGGYRYCCRSDNRPGWPVCR